MRTQQKNPNPYPLRERVAVFFRQSALLERVAMSVIFPLIRSTWRDFHPLQEVAATGLKKAGLSEALQALYVQRLCRKVREPTAPDASVHSNITQHDAWIAIDVAEILKRGTVTRSDLQEQLVELLCVTGDSHYAGPLLASGKVTSLRAQAMLAQFKAAGIVRSGVLTPSCGHADDEQCEYCANDGV